VLARLPDLNVSCVAGTLKTADVSSYVLWHSPRNATDHRRAATRYAQLVATAANAGLWDSALRRQIYLGDEGFVERMQALAEPGRSSARGIPKAQRRKRLNLAQWLTSCGSREEARYKAYTESGLSMSGIAAEMGLSVSRVSRLIGWWRRQNARPDPRRALGG
jgi:putative transposase